MVILFFKKLFFRGALTSKPYAFLARPWEFKSVDSIDVFDSLASNIRIDIRGDKILRILPRANDSINEDWISDKVRFVCDAVRLQRVDVPILNFYGSFYPLSWSQAFDLWSFASSYSNFFSTRKVNHLGVGYSKVVNPLFVSGSYLDLDSSIILNKINNSFFFNVNSSLELIKNRNLLGRSSYLFNSSLKDLSDYDSVVLVNCNLKIDAPVLSIRFRALAKSGIRFYSFGKVSTSHTFVKSLGSASNFFDLLRGKHWLANRLTKTKTFFLFDESFYFNSQIAKSFKFLNLNFGVFSSNVASLNTNESLARVNSKFDRLCSSVQFLSNVSSTSAFDFFKFLNSSLLPSSTFKVGLASHGGLITNYFDLLVPVSFSFEHSKNYLNCLGLIQKTRLALVPPNNVLDSSDILIFYYLFLLQRYLVKFDASNKKLFFINWFHFFSSSVTSIDKTWEYVNFFFKSVESNTLIFVSLIRFFYQLEVDLKVIRNDESFEFFSMPLKVFNAGSLTSRAITDLDFYQNDEISLNSSTLVAASRRLIDKRSFF